MSRVSSVLKYLIFFVNFFFWVMGMVMIGVGTWAYLHKNQFDLGSVVKGAKEKGAFDFIFDAAVVLVAIGVIIFILAFSGCVGALRENQTMLKFFYMSLSVIFLLELVGATLAFVFAARVQDTVSSTMRLEVLSRYRDDMDLMNMIDFFQKEFGCCGIGPDGYKDWNMNPYFNCSKSNGAYEKCAVPFSCCVDPMIAEVQRINTMCGYNTLSKTPFELRDTIYTEGCMQRVLNVAQANLNVLGGIAVAVAIVQIMAILFARVLDTQIQDQLESYAVPM